ncbi:16S rRNA (cytidine(1402)-2'-O)-methyltransferase [Aquisalimonas lutea]|nr:16S rRNA (cytidine(1402)-2'-O)-methyltransferase [Aquisalimonas lutea]MDN3517404.1 16S rRNA (cytidine(1402)-2'-O)-methyltransferase [Aquisalimonas lutea]
MSPGAGILYVVATPIGNLGDMTPRAVEILRGCDLVAAEDTRHSGRLLAHFGIRASLRSLHEHNENERTGELLDRLAAGASIALISDAGTPLVSDPGYQLVRGAHQAGVRVIPVPGACSPVAALSASGLPTDRFSFEGFLPARAGPRQRRLQALEQEQRTMVFLESSHRIEASLEAMAAVLGEGREAVMAREITKAHETVRAATLAGLRDEVRSDPDQRRGEFVLVVAGAPAASASDAEQDRVLGLLLAEMPVKRAAALAARILDRPRNDCYRRALALRDDSE